MKNLTPYNMIAALFQWQDLNHVDSAGSQFFIVHKDNNQLDGKYTVFGRLVPRLTAMDLMLLQDFRLTMLSQPLDASRVYNHKNFNN